MVMGRKPVYTFRTYQARKDINGSAILFNEVDDKIRKNKSQLKNGNKCGHDSKNIRFYEKPSDYKRSWHVIEESNRRLRHAIANPHQYPELHGLMYKKGRKKRTEYREAKIHLLLAAIIDSVNLNTMQLGHFADDGSFIHYDYDRLVTLTKMNKCRVNRHMLNLKKNGLIEVQKIVKTLNDGHIVTTKVIITVSDKIFEMLGTQDIFLEDREKSIRNRIKKQNQYETNQKRLALFKPRSSKDKKNASIFKQTSSILKNITRHSPSIPEYNPAQDKKVLSAVGILIKADPSISLADAIRMVTDRNKAPPH